MNAAHHRARFSNSAAGTFGLVVLAATLAACQPLPHPFADDRPPAELLAMPDSAGISVAPVTGEPAAAAAKLAAAVARALQQHDIPASEKTTNLGSYLLYGRLSRSAGQNGSTKVTADWRLYNAKGARIGGNTAAAEAKTAEWEAGDAKPIEQLAAASAAGIAPMVEDEAPVEAAKAPPDGARIRIAIHPLSGAPGDGGKSLARAAASVLQRQALAIVENGQQADLTIDGEVSVTPAKANTQHVKIVWHVRRADGAEIGTVGQENDVPKGMLEGPWGDLAYSVALAAGEGLMQLVERGAPPSHS